MCFNSKISDFLFVAPYHQLLQKYEVSLNALGQQYNITSESWRRFPLELRQQYRQAWLITLCATQMKIPASNMVPSSPDYC